MFVFLCVLFKWKKPVELFHLKHEETSLTMLYKVRHHGPEFPFICVGILKMFLKGFVAEAPVDSVLSRCELSLDSWFSTDNPPSLSAF